MDDALGAFLALFGMFGGVSLLVWTSTQAKIARIKAEAQARQMTDAPQLSNSALAEIKALRQQMEQMQSTSHQFDISFDEALSRLDGRVSRLETKSAVSTSVTTDTPQTLKNGQG